MRPGLGEAVLWPSYAAVEHFGGVPLAIVLPETNPLQVIRLDIPVPAKSGRRGWLLLARVPARKNLLERFAMTRLTSLQRQKSLPFS